MTKFKSYVRALILLKRKISFCIRFNDSQYMYIFTYDKNYSTWNLHINDPNKERNSWFDYFPEDDIKSFIKIFLCDKSKKMILISSRRYFSINMLDIIKAKKETSDENR